ncbi:putative ef hand family protein [Monocercomonoides exilis]|uniref:putative ef hand family protein n=1 Tax=Monocercomonoides exilis TaxID=2049356 RepID=UPI003559D676|nr:putative ef hand family protein [Monocercomonoides exilis]|eukprot:MONOS_8645.1-p1 / transcript=MONOS_8645.1 / gene=MONOS_8645 / organism=Monocercomonoides_exilis_PA203 / gene_product=EF hand family protein / transcript_product=EF hand family protein / location=Mono_scaffold00331:20499-23953(+) / protein_length=972 / sequence_SO=supercontig / SO=protein_coding / is_pseudo=false
MSYYPSFLKVLQQCHLRGIRVGEFFKDFDPLRSCKCTPSQFARVLSAEKFTLSPEDINLLVEAYKEPDGKMVNYKRFTDEVEASFVGKELEKSPTTKTRALNLSTVLAVTLPPEEEELYQKTLRELQEIVHYRRMNVMEHFQDHDRLKNHHITQPQFIRCMPFSLSEEQLRVLCKKYTDGKPQDGVNYHKFVFDISNPPPEEDSTSQWVSTGSLRELEKPKQKPPEAVAVITKVQAMVLKGSIRLMEFFSDYDKLRSGICLPEHFRTALSAAKIELTGPELDALEAQLRVSETDRRMRYRDFVNEVDEVFGAPRNMETQPYLCTQPVSLRSLIPSRSPDLSEETIAFAQKTLDQICTFARKRRPLTKTFFQAFDITNCGRMPAPPFRSTVFAHYGGSALTDEMLLALSKYYTDPATGDVRYLDFLNDVEDAIAPLEMDAGAEIFRSGRQTSTNPAGSTSTSGYGERSMKTMNRPLAMKQASKFTMTTERKMLPEFRPETKAPSIDVLLERMKLQELRERMRLSEFMKDYDPLRKGLIPRTRFRSALNLAKVELSEREFEMLVEEFSDPTQMAGLSETHRKSQLDTSDSLPTIRWMDFCDTVDSIFTSKKLEKAPTRHLEPAALSTLRNLSIIDPVYSTKSEALQSVISEYHEIMVTRRLFMKPAFQDFDRHNNGRVTVAQFRQALDILKLPINESRANLLCAHYRDMIVPTDVNYLAFLRDVERESAEELQEKEEMKQFEEMAATRERDFAMKRKMQREAARASITDSEMLRHLQSRTKQKSIRWKEFFVDFDPLRTGYVAKQRFRSCCDSAGMTLTDEEFDFCINSFCDDPENRSGMVHYTAFADTMDSVVTMKGYEENPSLGAPEWIPPTKKGLSTPLSPEEEQMVSEAIQRFHKIVKNRGLFMKPHLKDFDRLHNGHITAAQFQGSCGTLGLGWKSEDEMNAVIEKFSDSLGFLYIPFVDSCEEGRIVQ